MDDADGWAILSDRELLLNLDFQFRQCFDRPLPDIEELIEVLSTVHTVLERLLRAEDVSRVLDHVHFCRQFEEVSDLASTLLEPFRGVRRYSKYFDESTPKISRDDYSSGLTSAATTNGSLRYSDDCSQPQSVLEHGGASHDDVRPARLGSGELAYTPSWDTHHSLAEALQGQVPVLKSGTARRPSRIISDQRALTADFVLAAPSDLSDQLVGQQRLEATTGSFPSPQRPSEDHQEPVLGQKLSSLTPKAVGKYLSDGSRVHSFASSKRSLFANRRRSNVAAAIEDASSGSFFFNSDFPTSVSDGGDVASVGAGTSSSPKGSKNGRENELSGDSGKDTFAYLTLDELRPSANPGRDISSLAQVLPVQDWPEIFHTLNTLRSLARFHHDHIVASANLHTLVVPTIKLIDNLRSALAKNAMLALGDLFEFVVPAAMDLEVPKSIDCLIKVALLKFS